MPVIPKIPLPKGDRWMPSSEVASLFGVDQETINRWRREKKLRGFTTGKRFFYRKSDVNKRLADLELPQLV